jgi:YbbR domain-containing protein
MRVDLKSLRALLLDNKRIKLLSLLMAVLSWHMIRDSISLEVVIPDIRLQIRAREGTAVLNQSAATVDVTFRGSQEDVQRLDPRRIQAVVELPDDGAAMPSEIEITPAIIRGVRGARAVAVHPTRIHVALDRQDQKRLPVKARTVGVPLFGAVESVVCEPGSVILRGPAARLRTTEAVYTQPVDVDGRVESFSRHAAIQAPGDNWVAEMDPAEVQVKVTIVTRTGGKEWKAMPVKAVVDPGQAVTIDIEPSAVDVVVTGRSNVLAQAETGQLCVFANCSGLSAPGTYTVPVRVYAGSAEAFARPDQVSVTLNVK